MERVDFTNAVEDARYKINSWIRNETHGECNAQFFHRSVICEYGELSTLQLGVFCTQKALLFLIQSNDGCYLKLL